MNDKKRNRTIAGFLIVIAAAVGIGIFVIPDVMNRASNNNIRFDEVSLGELCTLVPLDYSKPINDIIVIDNVETSSVVTVACYEVVQGFDVMNLLSNVGVDYGPVAKSVYGIVYKVGSTVDQSPVYRFLFQASSGSRDAWYMTRDVKPIYEYTNSAKIDVKVMNEGITVDDVLDGIDRFLANAN